MTYDSTIYDAKSNECPDIGSIDNSDVHEIDRSGGGVSQAIRPEDVALEGIVSNDGWDFESLPTSGVILQDSSLQQAGAIGQSVVWMDQQWLVYQQALAIFGFRDWLRLHSDIPVLFDRCSTLQPPWANLLAAACNLIVGDFRLCLIPTGALGDDRIEIPRAAVDVPELAAHFYVLVEVLEDCGYVQTIGVAPRDRLVERFQESAGSTRDCGDNSWSYTCLKDWFEYSADDLLLWLRAADGDQVELPQPVPQPVNAQLRARLQDVQSQLAEQPIWQLLDWPDAMPLLVSPGWVDWLYSTAKGVSNLPLPVHSESLDSRAGGVGMVEGLPHSAGTKLLDRALNVGMWLHDRVGALGEELSWMMMPPLSPQSPSQLSPELVGMRAVEEDVDTIIGQLTLDGLAIPTYARGAYRVVQWAEHSLRLYALTWPHLSPDNVPEWTLLLVLGPSPGQGLPPLTRLRVRDASQLLVEQISSPHADDGYLYAHVVGTWDEQFWATIDSDCAEYSSSSATSCSAIYLPPFQFKPGVVQL